MVWAKTEGGRGVMKSNPPIAYSEVGNMRYGQGKTLGAQIAMNEPNEGHCGKCGAPIDPSRRVDFTLKDGTRVCESCFVKGTERATEKKRDWSN
jgi:hypothetical protein